MFPVRLIHPEHGAMHAYDQAELVKLIARGWTAEEQKQPILHLPKKLGRPKKVVS